MFISVVQQNYALNRFDYTNLIIHPFTTTSINKVMTQHWSTGLN